jgi:site-specific recombinase XerD
MPDLGALIADFLADAEASGSYSREQLRELRANLSHVVASDLGSSSLPTITGSQIDTLMTELRAAGVSTNRTEAIVAALRVVFAYAVGRRLIRSSPLVGRAPVGTERPSPTTAVLELGRRAAAWTVRGIVIAFALTVIGLILALA